MQIDEEKIKKIVFLALWCLFIVIIYCFFIKPYISDNKKDESKKENELGLVVTNLRSGNYSFSYSVNNNVSYSGSCTNNICNGVKKENGINEEYLYNDKYYALIDDQKVLKEDALLDTYLNINYLFNNYNVSRFEQKDKTYTFKNSDIYVKIDTSNKISIEVEKGNDKILMIFENIS